MTDSDLKSKKPVNAELARSLREDGIAQGLYTEKHLEEWMRAQEDDNAD